MTLSLQLYSMRDCTDQIDLLSKLQAMGITAVEGYGGVYDFPKAYRTTMKVNGITMPSGHMSLDDIETDFDATLKVITTLGITRIYAPYLEEKDRPTTAVGYRDLADRLNVAAARYAEHDIDFGWHNHDFEFVALPDGSIPMDILLTHAPDIKWEADLAWIVRGGRDPLDYIARYGDRINAVHVKDIAPAGENLDEDGWADLGAGTLDWAAYLKACRAQRDDIIYALEHDKPSDPISYATRSAVAFKALWGATND